VRPDLRGRTPEVAVIAPGILVGEYPRPEDVVWLRREHGISAVLSLQDDHDLWDKGLSLASLEDAYRRERIEFRRLPVADMSEIDLSSALSEAVDLLHELVSAGHTVLLHCNAGVNRSPTVGIAYLCAHGGMSLDEACRLVKGRRGYCLPFMAPLRERYR
jgi:protein-tyrosine phosphatase